ncbi:hypothetical protein [Streptomyces sp. NPDC047061]
MLTRVGGGTDNEACGRARAHAHAQAQAQARAHAWARALVRGIVSLF